MGLRDLPHYFGRGRLHFGAPLNAVGAVDASDDASWGANWPAVAPALGGMLVMSPGRFVGNARSLTLTPVIERLNVPAYDSGDSDVVQEINGSIVLMAHGARNLGDLMRSLPHQSAGNTRVDRVSTGAASLDAESMLFTAEVIDLTQPVTVTPSWTDWDEGVHWERSALGVRLLQGMSGPAGSHVDVQYVTEGDAYWLEAFERSRVTVGIVFAGVNLFDGKPARVDCYRAEIRPDEDFEVISQAAGEIRLSFRLQPVRPFAPKRPRWFRIMRGSTAHA